MPKQAANQDGLKALQRGADPQLPEGVFDPIGEANGGPLFRAATKEEKASVPEGGDTQVRSLGADTDPIVERR